MQNFTFIQGKYTCKVSQMATGACPCIYCVTDQENADQLAETLAGQKLTLVTISGVTWEDELSPWPAPKDFSSGADFSGGADKFIQVVEQEILPKVEAGLDFAPTYRIVAGYSLAGLWSLYTLYKTKIFSRVVCASGSLWYDGFLDFMWNNQMLVHPDKIYFSLGDREKLTNNKRLATVEDCMQDAEILLQQQGINSIFEKNTGGHFQESVERVAKGIHWALE